MSSDWSLRLPADWKTVGFKMDPDLYRQFKMLCVSRGWKVSRVLHYLIQQFVTENEIIPIVQTTLVEPNTEFARDDPAFDRLHKLMGEIQRGNHNSVLFKYLRDEVVKLQRQGIYNSDLFATAEAMLAMRKHTKSFIHDKGKNGVR